MPKMLKGIDPLPGAKRYGYCIEQRFSTDGPWPISGPQHVSRVDHGRLCILKMGLHAE